VLLGGAPPPVLPPGGPNFGNVGTINQLLAQIMSGPNPTNPQLLVMLVGQLTPPAPAPTPPAPPPLPPAPPPVVTPVIVPQTTFAPQPGPVVLPPTVFVSDNNVSR
jgi:hypothetical protein